MDNKITGSETSIGIADEIAKLKKLLDDGILMNTINRKAAY